MRLGHASIKTWSVWGEYYIVADFAFDEQEERLLDYQVTTISRMPGSGENIRMRI